MEKHRTSKVLLLLLIFILGSFFVPILSQQISVITIAGSTVGYQDGFSGTSKFNGNWGIAMDLNGNFYICDFNNHVIRKLSHDLTTVTTFVGSGVVGSSDGVGTAASFDAPFAIVFHSPSNSLFVTDKFSFTIRRIFISNSQVTTFAGTPGVSGLIDGIGVNARFKNPHGIALSLDKNFLFVCDSQNNAIRQITISNANVVTLTGNGVIGSQDGTLATSQFYSPFGIVVTSDGDLLISDMNNHKIRKISISQNQVTTVAGNGIAATTNGPALTSSLITPYGIVLDRNGNLLIGQTVGAGFIRILNLQTSVLDTFCGTGVIGSQDGFLASVTVDKMGGAIQLSNGDIIWVDFGQFKIRKFVFPPIPTTGTTGITSIFTTGTTGITSIFTTGITPIPTTTGITTIIPTTATTTGIASIPTTTESNVNPSTSNSPNSNSENTNTLANALIIFSIIFIVTAILILIIVVFYLHRRKKKKETSNEEEELKTSASRLSKKEVENWDIHQVIDWMKEELKMKKDVCEKISKNNISGRVLVKITSDDLKEIGIVMGDRKIILEAVEKIK